MAHRITVASLATAGLIAIGAAVSVSPAAAGEWQGNGWNPWQGYTWSPYWRPYVYTTPYTYGYRDDGIGNTCHTETRKVRIVDDLGVVHKIWKKVRVCE